MNPGQLFPRRCAGMVQSSTLELEDLKFEVEKLIFAKKKSTLLEDQQKTYLRFQYSKDDAVVVFDTFLPSI